MKVPNRQQTRVRTTVTLIRRMPTGQNEVGTFLGYRARTSHAEGTYSDALGTSTDHHDGELFDWMIVNLSLSRD